MNMSRILGSFIPGSTGPISEDACARGETLPLRITVWLASIVDAMRSGCAAQALAASIRKAEKNPSDPLMIPPCETAKLLVNVGDTLTIRGTQGSHKVTRV